MNDGGKFLKNFFAVIAFLLCLMVLVPVQLAECAEKTIVILARHGQTDSNKYDVFQGQLDTPLNDMGLAEADSLAAYLKDIPIDIFVSSPLKRAYVTTEKCAALKGMEVGYTDPRLMEIDYGEWTGKNDNDIKKEEPEAFHLWKKQPWKVHFPGGESLEELQNRYCDAMNDIVERYPGKTIFIGGHSKGNVVFICNVLGFSLEHYRQFKQYNTCINVFEYKKGKWKLITMNAIPHLGKLYK